LIEDLVGRANGSIVAEGLAVASLLHHMSLTVLEGDLGQVSQLEDIQDRADEAAHLAGCVYESDHGAVLGFDGFQAEEQADALRDDLIAELAILSPEELAERVYEAEASARQLGSRLEALQTKVDILNRRLAEFQSAADERERFLAAANTQLRASLQRERLLRCKQGTKLTAERNDALRMNSLMLRAPKKFRRRRTSRASGRKG
jgi:hypothetical protein